jgi:phage/plasmid-like protein (TIGR03299 family)
MAHQITARDVFGEVRANGERAWHGLGVELPEGLTAEEGFKRINLGWETGLYPTTVRIPQSDGTFKEVVDTDFNMHVRMDTFQSLGVVGKGYKPMSNMTLARFMDSLVGSDATVKLETAGSLRGGRRVFGSVRLPKTIEVVNDDILELFIIGSTAHDGSAATQFYGSSIRPVCANTLGWSENCAVGMVKFQHSGDVEAKVEVAQAALGILVKGANDFEKEVKAVAKMNLKKEQVQGYFEACYHLTFGQISAELPQKEQERRAEHKTKTIAKWLVNLEDEKQQIKGIRGTAWAAYNAFSQWSDHERGRFKDVAESDARVHSNLFGISHNDKKKAWGAALALV